MIITVSILKKCVIKVKKNILPNEILDKFSESKNIAKSLQSSFENIVMQIIHRLEKKFLAKSCYGWWVRDEWFGKWKDI